MVGTMKAPGRTINVMAAVMKDSATEIHILETMRMVKFVAKEFTHGRTLMFTMVNGSTV